MKKMLQNLKIELLFADYVLKKGKQAVAPEERVYIF